MILADFAVAFVIVLGLAVVSAVIARDQYRRRHPPPTMEEVTARLEEELAAADKKLREIQEDKE